MELTFYYIPFRTYPLGAIDEKDIENERYGLVIPPAFFSDRMEA